MSLKTFILVNQLKMYYEFKNNLTYHSFIDIY